LTLYSGDKTILLIYDGPDIREFKILNRRCDSIFRNAMIKWFRTFRKDESSKVTVKFVHTSTEEVSKISMGLEGK
jgi:hypothetical protein